MGTTDRFEDLESWKVARELCQVIYTLTRKKKFNEDFSLRNQILSSSGSGMDNISEGFHRGGNKEFIQFLYVSNGSLGEMQSQLYRARDRNYITEDEFQTGYTLARDVIRLNFGMIRYLKNSSLRGGKYRTEE